MLTQQPTDSTPLLRAVTVQPSGASTGVQAQGTATPAQLAAHINNQLPGAGAATRPDGVVVVRNQQLTDRQIAAAVICCPCVCIASIVTCIPPCWFVQDCPK